MQAVILVIASIVMGLAPLPLVKAEPPNTKEPTAPKTTVVVPKEKEQPKEEIIDIAPTAIIEQKPIQTPAPSQPADNETIAWNFLINQGFSRNQAAGIAGNLRQEHNFNTSDVPGGLGIAQWMGNRRDNLMARANYSDITVQLQFLVDELGSLKSEIMAYDSVEHAAVIFQNKFERCGVCMESQRIQYAYDILSRH